MDGRVDATAVCCVEEMRNELLSPRFRSEPEKWSGGVGEGFRDCEAFVCKRGVTYPFLFTFTSLLRSLWTKLGIRKTSVYP